MPVLATLVVGTDFSERSLDAAEAAAEMTHWEGTQRLLLVHALDPTLLWGGTYPWPLSGDSMTEQVNSAVADARMRLETIATRVSAKVSGATAVEFAVKLGPQSASLCDFAAAMKADALIVATQGRGAIQRAVMGSFTTEVLHRSRCPVLVVGKGRRKTSAPKKIVAAVDLSAGSEAIFAQAMALAQAVGGAVTVLSIFDRPFMVSGDHLFSLHDQGLPFEVRKEADLRAAVAKWVEAARRSLPTASGVDVHIDVVGASTAHRGLVDYTVDQSPDALLMGRSGHRTFEKVLFGANAVRVVAESACPVWVVPPPMGVTDEARSVKHAALVYAAVEPKQLVATLTALVDAGIRTEDISVVMDEETHLAEVQPPSGPSDAGMVAGVSVGGAVGGVLGGLASLGGGAAVGLMVAGPAVALGLVGGILGTLLGPPENPWVARLRDQVVSHKILVSVHTLTPESVVVAKTAFADAGVVPHRLRV